MKEPQAWRKFRAVEVIEPPKKTFHYAVDKDSKFVWTTGADVQKIWRKYGWTPPSEYRNDYLFKKNREIKDD